jgi:hypothetical protein
MHKHPSHRCVKVLRLVGWGRLTIISVLVLEASGIVVIA